MLLGAAALLTADACNRSSKPPAVSQRPGTQATDAERAASWERAIQGRTIARAESKFILIQNDSCPGTRTITSHFEQAGGALLQITEDNSELQCTEGIVSRPLVLVWRKNRYDTPPDTIHIHTPWIRAVNELLEGADQGGMLPSENSYYSIETGKYLFRSQFRAVSFLANTRTRYLGVAAGSDTMATVTYSTGSAIKETLKIPNPHDSSTRDVVRFIVDSMSLDGPGRQCCNNIAIASGGKDTLAVTGVTLTFWLGSDGEGVVDFPSRRFVVRVVNDRLVHDAIGRN